MGMYNLVHGEERDVDVLLKGIGLGRDDFARYRDCWVSEDRLIAVYTRLGGGNSECWCDGDDHECYVPTIEKLREHPQYVRDQDDDFDITYKTFYFDPPDAIPESVPSGPSGDERWAATLEALKNTEPSSEPVVE